MTQEEREKYWKKTFWHHDKQKVLVVVYQDINLNIQELVKIFPYHYDAIIEVRKKDKTPPPKYGRRKQLPSGV